jgi:L-fuconate dehydratase
METFSSAHLVVKAAESLAKLVVGVSLKHITDNFAAFWRKLTSESQLRWVRMMMRMMMMMMTMMMTMMMPVW